MNEEGSILLTALVLMLILSVFGIFALNTSDYEIDIAGNQQRFEENFNTSEGGASKEGAGIGYAGVNGQYQWYEISDPTNFNVSLFPNTLADYDPSGDDMPIPGVFPNDFSADDPNTWPRENLLSDVNDDILDYGYLVTYLGEEGSAPKGTNAAGFAAYKFRINGQRVVSVEMGGVKLRIKNPL